MTQTDEATWPVRAHVDVAWGDMDAFQHVNNVVYLRWFETARIELFARAGILDRMNTERIGPILATTSCTYLRPVTFPDTVTVMTRCTRVGRSSFGMSYRVTSERLGIDCAEGDCVIVMVNYDTGISAALDDHQRAALISLSAETSQTKD